MAGEQIQPNKKLRVGIIFGGRSAEHEVSLTSARAVLDSLDPARYEVTLIGLTREGRWLSLGQNLPPVKGQLIPAELMQQTNPTYTALMPDPSIRSLPQLSNTPGKLAIASEAALDVVFPVLHGPYGEDGTMQGLLELANLPYVGCGVMASSVGMDKVMAREVFRQYGLPVLDYMALKRHTWEHSEGESREALLNQIEQAVGFPCFIKPVNMGSSVGISKARNREQLVAALDTASRFDRKLMIERALDKPRELEIAVLGNDEPQASVVGEVLPNQKADFYDYKAKYQDDEIGFAIPAAISEELSERLRSLAVQAYLALDCAGMTRVDFFQDRATGEIYLNEVNTIPGFTPVSMYPMMWQKSGLSYSALLDKLIELALERHADKNRNELTM